MTATRSQTDSTLARRRRGGEDGFLLIALAVTVPLVAIALGAYASRSLHNLEAARQYQADTAALHHARAGVDRALYELYLDPDWRDGFSQQGIGAGAYSVTVEDETTLPTLNRRLRIRATGTSPGSTGDSTKVLSVIAATHIIRTVVGDGTDLFNGDGAAGTATAAKSPHDLAWGPDGAIWFTTDSRVRRFDPDTTVVTTIVGGGFGSLALGDDLGDYGPAISGKLNDARGLGWTADGSRLYIADAGNARVRVVNYGPDPIPIVALSGLVQPVLPGEIATIAGAWPPGYWGDGDFAYDARFGVDVNGATPDGDVLYISDATNQRVRAMNTSLAMVTIGMKVISPFRVDTVYGDGTTNYGADGAVGFASGMSGPGPVEVDGSGDVWVPLEGHEQVFKLERATGLIRHVAGLIGAGLPNDGNPALSAGLGGPTGLGLRGDGSWLLASRAFHTMRTIDTAAVIDTSAGKTHVEGYAGDGGPPTAAELDHPRSVIADPADEDGFYFTDQDNHRIRQVLKKISVTGYTED